MRASEVKSERDLWLLIAKTAILAVVVQSLFEALFHVEIPPDGFDLQPKGWAYFPRLFGMIAIAEVAPVVYAASMHGLGLSPSIRGAAILVMAVPLIAGGIWMQLSEFSAVSIDQNGVQLRGVSVLADHDYAFAQIDQVVVKKGRLADQLLFRWYDEVRASCWIYRFDRRSMASLHALVQEFEKRGFKVGIEESGSMEIIDAKKRHPVN